MFGIKIYLHNQQENILLFQTDLFDPGDTVCVIMDE